MTKSTPSNRPLRRQTKLVRGGLARSHFKETAEAIYMTSGFVYDSAAEADARFAGTEPGFVYGRYGNPTVRMFEERLAGLEGAEDCLAAKQVFVIHAAFCTRGIRMASRRGFSSASHRATLTLVKRLARLGKLEVHSGSPWLRCCFRLSPCGALPCRTASSSRQWHSIRRRPMAARPTGT
jgi:cystathionine beta-lyase/cystathionine gamma-synthase